MTPTHDDSFREIHLSGKALVFGFMAVVVIAVTIFLAGLQVGRGGTRGTGSTQFRSGSCRRGRAATAANPRNQRLVDIACDRGRKTQLRRALGIVRADKGAAKAGSVDSTGNAASGEI